MMSCMHQEREGGEGERGGERRDRKKEKRKSKMREYTDTN